MRVIITGGGGFIGTAVSRWCREYGHFPGVFDRPLDIRNYDALRAATIGADAVIHLAGMLGTHELFDTVHEAIDVNIKGTVNVLDVCRRRGMRYVGITMPDVFPSIYTATKVSAGRFASVFHHEYGLPVSNVRAFNAFGPGQAHGPGHPQKIIPTFAVNAWQGTPIPVWGDGLQTVDLIDVDTLARILVEALGFPGDDEYVDGGSGLPLAVLDVVDLVRGEVGRPVTVEHLPMRRGEEPTKIVATGEGWGMLSFTPEFEFDALARTIHSYRDWRPS